MIPCHTTPWLGRYRNFMKFLELWHMDPKISSNLFAFLFGHHAFFECFWRASLLRDSQSMTSWHLPSVTVSVEAFNYADLMVDESMLLGGFLSHGGTALSLDGLFHGNSEHKMDVLSLPPWIGNPTGKSLGVGIPKEDYPMNRKWWIPLVSQSPFSGIIHVLYMDYIYKPGY